MTEHAVCDAPNRPYLIARNATRQEVVFFRPRCKQWTCPACAAVNRALWTMRAYKGSKDILESGESLFFMTVTSHETLSPDQSVWVWPDAWGKLRDRMKYRAGGVFYYLMIPEHHSDGRLHVHAIESAGVSKTWLKKAARKSGLGYMDDEGKLNTPASGASYVTKYLTKSMEHAHWPRGFRRIRTSRNWPELDEPPTPEGWQFVPLPQKEQLSDELSRYADLGFHVEVMDNYAAWKFITADRVRWWEIDPS